MAKIDKIKDKPEGKPVKNKNWSDVKDYLKSLGKWTDQYIDDFFGESNPKYATDIEMADALRELLGVSYA